MIVRRAGDYTVSPWKNGGGTTTEIMAHPAGASLDAFEWRISMAAVEQDGPFSAFPGVDRTLSLYGGPRMALAFGGGRLIALTPEDPTIRFAGEGPVNAAVPEGPVGDFNVMTRRTRWQHLFERFALASETATLSRVGDGTLLFLAAGAELTCGDAAGNTVTLEERDCVLLEQADAAAWQLAVPEPVILFRVELFLSR